MNTVKTLKELYVYDNHYSVILKQCLRRKVLSCMDSLEIKRSAKPSIYNFQKYLLMSNYVSNIAWNFKSKCYLTHSRCACIFYFNLLASDHSTQQNQCQERKICFKSLLSREFQYTMVGEAWRDSWRWEHLRETPHKAVDRETVQADHKPPVDLT